MGFNKNVPTGRHFFFLFCFLLMLFGTTAAVAGNQSTVALVMKALSNPFFIKMEEGAKNYALGENIPLEVFGVEQETDIDRQIGIMENLIARGYGAIVIAPVDSKKLVPICKKAIEKNIVVINIDNPLHLETMNKYGISIPFVGSDNRAGAAMVGRYFKEKLNGRGKIFVIEGIRGVENADLRKQGFIEAVTKDSQIEITGSESANWHTGDAFSLAVKLLRAGGSINAIFAANDSMALGALQALDMMDLTEKVMVGGYDNIDAVRDEMRNGRIQATIEQHPELMGAYGVEMAWKGLNGEDIPGRRATPLDLITHESFNKTIGLSISNLENPFFSSLQKGIQEAADLFGLKLITVDAGNLETQQLADIYRLSNEKVDLLIINPTNSETIGPAIETANRNNVPVITVDRTCTEGKILSHIASDNTQGGRMAGELLAGFLKGKGRVIEIEGIPGTSASYERGAGFNEALKKYPGIKLVAREIANFDRNEARDIMMHILKKGIAFDAVFAHNDNMILGVMDALAESGNQPQPVLIGFDAIREAVKAIEKGKLSATIAQKPQTMGNIAVKNAVLFFRGQQLPPTVAVELKSIKK